MGIKENCGLFGIYGNTNAGIITYLGIYSLQHRGQESAGIVVSDKNNLKKITGMGLVGEIFDSRKIKELKGNIAIGHVRYSTTGSSVMTNIQPFLAKHAGNTIAIAHNGNFTNTYEIFKKLEAHGTIFQTTMDTEIIIHLMAMSGKKTLEDKLIYALKNIKGAYSLLLLTNDKLIGVRDPYGFRPLALGKLGNSYVLASETCAFDITGTKYLREVNPGEILCIHNNKLNSINFGPAKTKRAYCIFEFIYFARPDSRVFGENVYSTRKKLGVQLAKEHPLKVDIVMPIPDSGNYAALGYAQETGLPFEIGIVRNHYIGRTFIQPFQEKRNFGVKLKLNPVNEIIKNKKIAVVEDSIVRGTTSKLRIRTLRQAGAKEIHMLVSCPPIKYPCFYGIDFHKKSELIANKYSVESIRKIIGVDSLYYLSLEGMLKSMSIDGKNFCTACFTGKYPVPVKENFSKYLLEER